MDKLKVVSSKDGSRFIEVIKAEDGTYLLHKFVRKYDDEEDKNYEVRELPDPPGRYESLDVAIIEAQRILKTSD